MADREFIAAKDLPVTEAEEVNVLVVDSETGELAQKAGANLGGEKADMVIAFTMRVHYGALDDGTISVIIESGSLEAVAEALAAGRPPVVKCKRYYLQNGFDTSFPIAEGAVYDCDVYYYSGTIHISFAIPYRYMARISMDINDPDYLEVWLFPLTITGIQLV